MGFYQVRVWVALKYPRVTRYNPYPFDYMGDHLGVPRNGYSSSSPVASNHSPSSLSKTNFQDSLPQTLQLEVPDHCYRPVLLCPPFDQSPLTHGATVEFHFNAPLRRSSSSSSWKSFARDRLRSLVNAVPDGLVEFHWKTGIAALRDMWKYLGYLIWYCSGWSYIRPHTVGRGAFHGLSGTAKTRCSGATEILGDAPDHALL